MGWLCWICEAVRWATVGVIGFKQTHCSYAVAEDKWLNAQLDPPTPSPSPPVFVVPSCVCVYVFFEKLSIITALLTAVLPYTRFCPTAAGQFSWFLLAVWHYAVAACFKAAFFHPQMKILCKCDVNCVFYALCWVPCSRTRGRQAADWVVILIFVYFDHLPLDPGADLVFRWYIIVKKITVMCMNVYIQCNRSRISVIMI